jgi:hypothetical protein
MEVSLLREKNLPLDVPLDVILKEWLEPVGRKNTRHRLNVTLL